MVSIINFSNLTWHTVDMTSSMSPAHDITSPGEDREKIIRRDEKKGCQICASGNHLNLSSELPDPESGEKYFHTNFHTISTRFPR